MLGESDAMTIQNVYPIENLSKLSCEYRLYRVKGLSPLSPEYEKNRQKLVDMMSRMTHSPCATYQEEGQLYIAQQTGYQELPRNATLVRAQAILEPVEGTRRLDFGTLTDADIHIVIRFLEFSLKGPLFSLPQLWQPEAGRPFYHKTPDSGFAAPDAYLYKGFSFRLVPLPSGKIGVSVDTSSKYVSKSYLSAKISADQFHHIKGKRAVYEFGNRWYEIGIEGMEELSVSDITVRGQSLFDYVHNNTAGSKSRQLMAMPRDCSVLVYYTKMGEPMRVPSSLCRLTFHTKHRSVKPFHKRTIRRPDVKNQEIEFVVTKYLTGLKFSGVEISLGPGIRTKTKRFPLPDLLYGNGSILSVDGRANAVKCAVHEIGEMKKKLLSSTAAGFYITKPLHRQYLILPKSVHQSYGKAFLKDLQYNFAELYGNNSRSTYEPVVLEYDDSVNQSIPSLGRAILKPLQDGFAFSGNAVVMIPTLAHGNKEDELANLVMRELRNRHIIASVIHKESTMRKYEEYVGSDGKRFWAKTKDPKGRGMLNGYLYNVVLNKILIPNACYPFMLAKRLHGDLIVGIDVKNHTAGFTFIHGDGRNLRFFSSSSQQSEQLSRDHIKGKLCQFVRDEQSLFPTKNLKKFVVHRDGRAYPEEIEGVKDALDVLAKEGRIAQDYELTVVEIRKTSSQSIRFFESVAEEGSQRDIITNPVVGTYEIYGNDAHVATTGLPYNYPGTARPLHMHKVYGPMDMEDVAQDVFDLSNLTWTKVDTCSRVPLSIKMTDMRLKDIAGDYPKDELSFEIAQEMQYD